MKVCSISFSRKIVYSLIAFMIFISLVVWQPEPVSAAALSVSPTNSSRIDSVPVSNLPRVEPTPIPQPSDEVVFNPDSVSITLIFETIIEWMFGKDLIEIFNEVELTEEQKLQIEILSGETNPINLVNNFCDQVRSGDFSRMADSVRESNREDDSESPSPAILMNFFEQLGAFCPAE
ncbi:MAG: hypothetical protein AB9891_20730 [Anaerolineaceae bacterium]